MAEEVAELAAAEARRLVHTAAALATGDGQESQPGVLEAIERAAQHSAAQIGLAAIAGVVDWAGQRTLSRTTCAHPDHPDDRPGCLSGRGARLVARRTKTVNTLLGGVEVTRGYYHCAVCKHGFAPLDTRLGVAGTSLSPGLARACALAGAEMAYDKSGEFIATVTGLDLASTSTLARATRTHGARARDLIATEQAAARPSPAAAATICGPDLCYLVIDGTGAPMLPSQCQGREGKNGGRAGTREVKIGCLFTQTSCDPATGDPVQDPGSVSYISTFEPASTFATQAKGEYHRRGFDQIRQPIVLGDGAKWIWAIAEEHFPHATQIVDYFHAREHLADLTKLLTPILGDTTAIATTVESLDLDQSAPELLKPAQTEAGYFLTNHHRMQYADLRANGYYIGSGPVESACNTIVKQRAKRAGMHWTIDGLDPVLALRTLHQSGRDDLLWPTPQN
ncbi:MAG: ISKra4 family transposase [Nocardioidaceae bacterium]